MTFTLTSVSLDSQDIRRHLRCIDLSFSHFAVRDRLSHGHHLPHAVPAVEVVICLLVKGTGGGLAVMLMDVAANQEL